MNPGTPTHLVLAPALRRSARLLGLAIVATLLLALPGVTPPAQSAAVSSIAAEQPLVTLLSVKSVHQEPIFGSRSLVGLADQRPLTLVRTSLPILDQKVDADGRGWLKVRMPGRVFHRKTPPS